MFGLSEGLQHISQTNLRLFRFKVNTFGKTSSFSGFSPEFASRIAEVFEEREMQLEPLRWELYTVSDQTPG